MCQREWLSHADDHAMEQARRNARDLRAELTSATGEPVAVKPLLGRTNNGFARQSARNARYCATREMYYSSGRTTISLKLPERLLARLEGESRARRTTKSSLVRECLEKQLPERGVRGKLPPLPPGKSVYDLALPILKRAWARRGRGVRDLATNRKYMEGFGK